MDRNPCLMARDSDTTQRIARRRMLRALGGAAAVGMAGCSGNNETPSGDGSGDGTPTSGDGSDGSSDGGSSDGGSTDDGTPTSGGEPVDDSLTLKTGSVPSDVQWNPFGSNTPHHRTERMRLHQLGGVEVPKFRAIIEGDEPKPTSGLSGLAKSYSNIFRMEDMEYESGDTVRIPLREGIKWWPSGNPLQAKDLKAQFDIERLVGTIKDYGEAEVVDQYTVDLSLETNIPQRAFVWKHFANNHKIQIEYDRFRDALEMLADATTEDERISVQDQLVNQRFDEPYGCSPFKVVESTKQEHKMELVEDHPMAENIEFSKVNIKYTSSSGKGFQSFKSHELDWGNMANAQLVKDLKGTDGIDMFSNPLPWMEGLYFAPDDEVLGDRRVRQAIAHVVDRKRAAKAAGFGTELFPPLVYPTAVPYNMFGSSEAWLGSDYQDKYVRYNSQEKAASLLRDAGFEKSGGTWKDGDGNPLKFDIKIASGREPQISGMESVVANLNQFGIDASIFGVDSGTFWGDVGSGNYRATYLGYGGTHPSNWYSSLLSPAFAGGGAYTGSEGDVKVDVPMPIGNPNGSEETINVTKEIETVSKEWEGEGAKAATQKLAWVVNQTVIRLPLWQFANTRVMNVSQWQFPSKDDPTWGDQLVPTQMVKKGKITPVLE